jgi:predicted nucleic acid-binding protein
MPGMQSDALADRLATAAELHAPHLIDVEFANTLRRLVRVGELTAERGAAVLARVGGHDAEVELF